MGLNAVIVRIDKKLYKIIRKRQNDLKKELGIKVSFSSASELISSELEELRKKAK